MSQPSHCGHKNDDGFSSREGFQGKFRLMTIKQTRCERKIVNKTNDISAKSDVGSLFYEEQ